MKKHEFFDFMKLIKDSMASEYERIQKRVLEDPGTAGDQAEENWAEFLRNWLPANYPVVTKGRILGDNGATSPQVDILVLHPSYPLQLRNKKLYFAGGVIAAFECKLTLKKEHIKEVFENAAIIKKLLPDRGGNPYDELHQLPIFGLLAHSHSWKNIRGDTEEKMSDYISEYELVYCKHPRELPDFICVADLAVYILTRVICIGQYASCEKQDFFDNDLDEGVLTCYSGTREEGIAQYDARGDILGTLIFELTRSMAFEDPNLRPFADYLARIDSYSGLGLSICWDKSVLSDSVVRQLSKEGYEEETWSKWAEIF